MLEVIVISCKFC